MTVGEMAMPRDFKYRAVFLAGRPRHQAFDSFDLKHPRMDLRRRAKIFSPFDALKGFSDAVAEKEILYTPRRLPDEEEAAELNRRLRILQELTRNGRAARAHHVRLTVTRFRPAPAEAGAAGLGLYESVRGVCLRVTPRALVLDTEVIPMEDLLSLEAEGGFPGPAEEDPWPEE